MFILYSYPHYKLHIKYHEKELMFIVILYSTSKFEPEY